MPSSHNAHNLTAGHRKDDGHCPLRAALWLRVSDPHQLIENQAPAMERLTAGRGMAIVKRYELRGRSAYKGAHLADIEQALADARAGLFEYLIIWALDRLSRGGIEACLKIVREFEEAGVTVISCQESYVEGTGDDRELLISVAAHTARRESKRRGERILAHRMRRLAQDRFPGGRPPLVYRVAEDGTLVIIPERRKIAELIYRLYTEERLGIDLIIRELHHRRIKSPYGKPFWSHNAVDWVLCERAYVDGVYLYEYTVGEWEDAEERTARIPAQAFVSKESFDRAQQLRTENPQFRHTAEGTEWPLNPMTCGSCRSRFRTDSGGTRRRTYYDGGRATNSRYARRSGHRCLAVRRLPADEIEPLMMAALLRVFSTPENFILALDEAKVDIEARLIELGRDVGDLDSELRTVTEKLVRLAEDWVNEELGTDKVDRMRAELKARQKDLKSQIDAVDSNRLDELDLAREKLRRYESGAEDWEEIAAWRAENGLTMDKFNFGPECAESDELIELRASGLVPTDQLDDERVTEELGRWLKKLHANLVAYPDHIEVSGRINFNVQLADDSDESSRQASHSGRGLG